MKIKVGVIFGGANINHEVSICEALKVIKNLDKNKYDVLPIYITKNKTWYAGKMLADRGLYSHFDDLKKYAKKVSLMKLKDEFVLRCNGGFRNDVYNIDLAIPLVFDNGALKGYLETIGMPLALNTSSLDKALVRDVLNLNDIKTFKYVKFNEYEYKNFKDEVLKKLESLTYPLILKSANLESIVTTNLVDDKKHLEKAIEEIFKYDNRIIVKEKSKLKKISCAVISNFEAKKVSSIYEINDSEYLELDLSDKENLKKILNPDFDSLIVNYDTSKELEKKINELVKKVVGILNLSGLTVVTILVDEKSNDLYIDSINSNLISLASLLFASKKMNFSSFLDETIDYAIEEYKHNLDKVATYDYNFLNTFNGKKKK